MAVEPIAVRHAAQQVSLGRRVAEELARLWRLIDPRNILGSWARLLPRALTILGAGQRAAAAVADPYVAEVVRAYGLRPDPAGRVDPSAFGGTASDGRPLESLLVQPGIAALELIAAGRTPAQALTSGGFRLDMIARTQIADAGRAADGTAIAAERQLTGYVRLLLPPSCSRCIILAGRVYEWSEGFERHPRCDCRHIPVAENVPGDVRTDPKAYFDGLTGAEQDRIFTRAGAEAIREGADMARVVNARRGMFTAADGRLYTTEAAGRRPRLMPEQIFRDAKDRDDAIRLLKLHGYIT